jgi:S1-C subfamily serine protease
VHNGSKNDTAIVLNTYKKALEKQIAEEDEKEKALKEFRETLTNCYEIGFPAAYDLYKELLKKFEIAEALNPDIDSHLNDKDIHLLGLLYVKLASNVFDRPRFNLPNTRGMGWRDERIYLINRSIKFLKKVEDWENSSGTTLVLGDLYAMKKSEVIAVDYYYKSAMLILNEKGDISTDKGQKGRTEVLEIIDKMRDNIPNSPLISVLMNRVYSTDSDLESQDIETEFTGSGFIVNEDGLVVTNYHVIKGKENIKVYLPYEGLQLKAELLLKDDNNDIAILRMDSYPRNRVSIPYGLGHSYDIKVGQDVFTVGFPLGEILGQHSKLSSGKVNSLYGVLDNPTLIQISNPIQPGNSGGALFNRKGEIIGIVISSLNANYFYESANVIPQNVNFAVKVDYLNALISMLPEANKILNRKSQIGNLSLEKQFDSIRPFVVQVLAN